MSNFIAKTVSMAPLTAPGSSQQDFTFPGVAQKFIDGHVPVVRIVADARSMHTGCGAYNFTSLDANIRAAKALGLVVMLSTYRFSDYENNLEGSPSLDDPSSPGFAAALPDRFNSRPSGSPAQIAALIPTQAKQLGFRLPTDFSPQGHWGNWITRLLARYTRGGPERPDDGTFIDLFEPLNEPNLLFWPQQSSSNTGDPYDPGSTNIQCALGQMYATVMSIRAAFPNGPYIVVGASSDGAPRNPRMRTPAVGERPDGTWDP